MSLRLCEYACVRRGDLPNIPGTYGYIRLYAQHMGCKIGRVILSLHFLSWTMGTLKVFSCPFRIGDCVQIDLLDNRIALADCFV